MALCASLGLAPAAHAAAPVREKDAIGLTERVERLERLLQNQGLLELLQQVQALQQDVNSLRGAVDVQTHALEQMRERERALHADMDRRLQALEPGTTTAPEPAAPDAGTEPPLESLSAVRAEDDIPAGPEADTPLTVETVSAPAAAAGTAVAAADAAGRSAGAALSAAAATASTGAAAAGVVAPGTDPGAAAATADQADYERAFWLLKQARYDDAIQAFRAYRAAWPKGQYSDSAQYWLGEGYHAKNNYRQALIEYERLIGEFPNSQKITHALLKSGYCLQELGRPDDARARLNDLAQRYPGTTAARLAEERLRVMTAAGRAP